jgi:uncharacterized membrane protein
MKKTFKHVKTHVFRGFLAIIPIILSYFVIRFLYITIDQRVTGLIARWVGRQIPGLGILLVLIFLYLMGLIASNWVGKGALTVLDRASSRIPLIKTVYHLGKQVAEALSLPEKKAFQRVVMVQQFREGVWTIGFVAGTIAEQEGQEENLLKVFVPTAPNPTAGFMIMLKESEVRDLDWTITDAMNTVISGGIISPDHLR